MGCKCQGKIDKTDKIFLRYYLKIDRQIGPVKHLAVGLN